MYANPKIKSGLRVYHSKIKQLFFHIFFFCLFTKNSFVKKFRNYVSFLSCLIVWNNWQYFLHCFFFFYREYTQTDFCLRCYFWCLIVSEGWILKTFERCFKITTFLQNKWRKVWILTENDADWWNIKVYILCVFSIIAVDSVKRLWTRFEKIFPMIVCINARTNTSGQIHQG